MKRILIASCISLAAAICLSVGCAVINLEDEIMQTKPIPTQQKLANITENQVTASVIWPHAEPWSYQLVIGLPQGTISDPSSNRRCPDFAATVSIIGPNGKVVQRFLITSEDAMECNWLDAKHDLDGVIVTWKRTELLRSCKPGERYTIRLDFERRSEVLNSFWISYLQSQEQRKQETEQPGTGQPATRPVDEPEGVVKPQPEAEGRSR